VKIFTLITNKEIGVALRYRFFSFHLSTFAAWWFF